MTQETVVTLGQGALLTIALVAAPVLLVSMAIGLLISLFQAVTQINEMTLTFVPKIVAVVGAMIVFGPWMMHMMLGYATQLFSTLWQFAR
ncbi:MAG: flagellar biosynthesis protein FliQ [Chloroflexi bacterium]|nr:flagellar biosynthesis protein FliQ [Chloroflexota bacterium]